MGQIAKSLETWSDLIAGGLSAEPLTDPDDPRRAWLRTVVQADGDMVITIDRDFLHRHPDRVGPEIADQFAQIEAALAPLKTLKGPLKLAVSSVFVFGGTLTVADAINAGSGLLAGGELLTGALWVGAPLMLASATARWFVRRKVRSLIDGAST